MSDGKSASYRVVSAAELERRALAAARDRCARAEAAMAAMEDRLAAVELVHGRLGVGRKRPTVSGQNSVAVDAYAEQLERTAAALRGDVDTALGARRTSDILDRVAGLLASMANIAPLPDLAVPITGLRQPPRRDRPSAAALPAAAVLERARSIAAALPADATEQEMARSEALVRELLSSLDGTRQETVLAGVRSLVQSARTRSALVASNRAVLDELQARLDGLDGSEVAALRGFLRGIATDAVLPHDLSELVEKRVAAARSERDRAFACEAMRDALLECGYDVGESFVTYVGTNEGALLPLQVFETHGIRVRERDGRLLFNVVRFDESGLGNRLQDTRAAESFCAGYARVSEAIEGRGLVLQPLREFAAGSGHVEVRSGPAPFERKTSADGAEQVVLEQRERRG